MDDITGQMQMEQKARYMAKREADKFLARRPQKPIEKPDAEKYIRVGNDYYKHAKTMDASRILHSVLITIKRQTLLDDHGKEILIDIAKYDAFTNVPDHRCNAPIPDNLYNIYTPVIHEPEPGEWKWTENLLRHVFGEQYELGLDYIQLLYLKPTQILPILCLVSKENATGKTTFLNWLQMIFGENVIVVGNQDIHGRFNSHYAGKLLIAVDESRIDKQAALEKLKALSTQRTIVMEGKFQDARNLPFFGKFILCSNYVDNFINATDEDIRYWIKKMEKPTELNLNIEDELRGEVPAFLYFLQDRQLSSEKKSRMWFAAQEIETDALRNVREESKTWLYKDMFEFIMAHFLEFEKLSQFFADPKDIKVKFFNHSKVELNYIRKVLKNDFKKEPKMVYYKPLSITITTEDIMNL